MQTHSSKCSPHAPLVILPQPHHPLSLIMIFILHLSPQQTRCAQTMPTKYGYLSIIPISQSITTTLTLSHTNNRPPPNPTPHTPSPPQTPLPSTTTLKMTLSAQPPTIPPQTPPRSTSPTPSQRAQSDDHLPKTPPPPRHGHGDRHLLSAVVGCQLVNGLLLPESRDGGSCA